MRAIDLIDGAWLGRWLGRLTERQTEIAFGAGTMLFVVFALLGGEMLARAHDALRAPAPGFDWYALMDAMQPGDEDAPPRFAPGTEPEGIAINALGFRGPDIAAQKPDGTIRLAFLGDSKLFSAEHAEEEMIAAQVTDRLAARAPACRFDQVTVAGPAYTMDHLAQLVRTDVAPLDPDVHVVLSGSMRDVLHLHAEADARGGYTLHYPWLVLQSRLADKLFRAFHLARQERQARHEGPKPDGELADIAQAFDGPAVRLADAIGQTPVLAIGYRGQLREGLPLDEQMAHTRQLRHETRGLGARDLARLNTLLVTAQDQAAQRLGWTFIDPIADIAPVAENFTDQSHFSRRGIAQLSDAVADALLPMLADQGMACLGGEAG
ncbi:hypothetical protein [Oceaniradius stylonematis]|uniref:hypothetical protein n=1 Tax=Oceaniradius stylonematis TaxID=2184161 RepID=UPI00273E09DC|nr:hypothetical protein [Oceaniradius stylonematis]